MCRAPVSFLLRGRIPNNGRGKRLAVAELRAERAHALAASGLALQAENDMAQLQDEQEAADVEAAMELQEAGDAFDEAEDVALEVHALAQMAQALEDERATEHERVQMQAFGGRIARELRSNWRVWLLACAYAGRVHGSMTQVEARAVATAAMREGQPVLRWGGVHGRFLYELGRACAHGRQHRRSTASSVDHDLLALLASSDLTSARQYSGSPLAAQPPSGLR
jgi:hypothetical protein